jgi:hypothetical protein
VIALSSVPRRWRQERQHLLDLARGRAARGPRRNKNGIAAKADRMHMPHDFVGHVMVFRTFDKISYGLVMDASAGPRRRPAQASRRHLLTLRPASFRHPRRLRAPRFCPGHGR